MVLNGKCCSTSVGVEESGGFLSAGNNASCPREESVENALSIFTSNTHYTLSQTASHTAARVIGQDASSRGHLHHGGDCAGHCSFRQRTTARDRKRHSRPSATPECSLTLTLFAPLRTALVPLCLNIPPRHTLIPARPPPRDLRHQTRACSHLFARSIRQMGETSPQGRQGSC